MSEQIGEWTPAERPGMPGEIVRLGRNEIAEAWAWPAGDEWAWNIGDPAHSLTYAPTEAEARAAADDALRARGLLPPLPSLGELGEWEGPSRTIRNRSAADNVYGALVSADGAWSVLNRKGLMPVARGRAATPEAARGEADAAAVRHGWRLPARKVGTGPLDLITGSALDLVADRFHLSRHGCTDERFRERIADAAKDAFRSVLPPTRLDRPHARPTYATRENIEAAGMMPRIYFEGAGDVGSVYDDTFRKCVEEVALAILGPSASAAPPSRPIGETPGDRREGKRRPREVADTRPAISHDVAAFAAWAAPQAPAPRLPGRRPWGARWER